MKTSKHAFEVFLWKNYYFSDKNIYEIWPANIWYALFSEYFLIKVHFEKKCMGSALVRVFSVVCHCAQYVSSIFWRCLSQTKNIHNIMYVFLLGRFDLFLRHWFLTEFAIKTNVGDFKHFGNYHPFVLKLSRHIRIWLKNSEGRVKHKLG